MFYHLLTPLAKQYLIFNLFNYISFRAAGATVTAILLAFVVGPAIIGRLRRRKIEQVIRAEGPASHLGKRGTPTMGGSIILIATVVPTLLWARLDSRFILFAILATLWMGAIGFLDDWLKVVQGKSRGLVAKWKLAGQVSFGVVLGTLLVYFPVVPPETVPAAATTVPFFKFVIVIFAPWLYVAFVTTVITGSSNAVNLTDGLDGLATGLSAIAAAAFALFAYILGRTDTTGYLNLFYLPGAGELTIFCAALMGGCVGFLWFNAHPAQVFMGDTGSLALGGAFGHRLDPAQVGVPAADHRRGVRGGGGVRHPADLHLQVAQAYPGPGVRGPAQGVPHGTAASSLREAWLAREHRGDAVLHPRDLLRHGGPGDPQAAMSLERWRAGGREAAVIGLGKSGVAAGRLLRREGIPVYASDSAAEPDKSVGEAGLQLLRASGAEVQLGGHDLARISRAGVCVVSPGVPPAAAPLQAARQAGVPVISELDVGVAGLPGVRFAAITGTNGKTTTTALGAHLLQAAGIPSVAAGNIGRPLAEVALAVEHPEWIVLEISSFQLHDTYDLAPAIGAMTNLAPDHLDRYETIDEYYADKDLLYRNATPSSCWILNGDDPEVLRRAAGRPGTVLSFRVQGRADAWYDPVRRQLLLGTVVLLPRAELALFGDHNVANALCAALIAREAGAGLAAIAQGLASFRALPHRMEPIGEVGGVLWINDSKATNIASTMVAMRALERPFVLLLGGRHKGEPYTALGRAAGEHCRGVVAFGESRHLVSQDLAGLVPVVDAGTDFGEVLRQAQRLARPGDAVLLSPACSSYDMFRNYEDRGAQFRVAVEQLPGAPPAHPA